MITESKHWRWLPGMRGLYASDVPGGWAGSRYCGGGRWLDDHAVQFGPEPRGIVGRRPWRDGVPHRADKTDAATKGCLLELVREAWEDPHLYTRWSRSKQRWEVRRDDGYLKPVIGERGTEWGALEAALLAAP